MKIGCRLGFISCNILVYADDVVILAPSATGLQLLIDNFCSMLSVLDLDVNINKTKCMVFSSKSKEKTDKLISIWQSPIKYVDSFKYLGFYIQSNMRDTEDIVNTRGKFYRDFNCILRKFAYVDKDVLLYFFRQYCLQLYSAELWLDSKSASGALKQFGIGYHKAVKKILNLSTHESNHYACQEAKLFTFDHLISKIKIFACMRFMESPCDFILKNLNFLRISSFYYKAIGLLLSTKYNIDSLLENDKDAVLSRIIFTQNHEPQLRNSVSL